MRTDREKKILINLEKRIEISSHGQHGELKLETIHYRFELQRGNISNLQEQSRQQHLQIYL